MVWAKGSGEGHPRKDEQARQKTLFEFHNMANRAATSIEGCEMPVKSYTKESFREALVKTFIDMNLSPRQIDNLRFRGLLRMLRPDDLDIHHP